MSVFLVDEHLSNMCKRNKHKNCKNRDKNCECQCHRVEELQKKMDAASQKSINTHMEMLSYG